MDKLLRHFGYGKIEKMKVVKPLRRGWLNRTKSSPRAVQQPSQEKGGVNFFLKLSAELISSPKPTWRFSFHH
jgi:hypothetical protein